MQTGPTSDPHLWATLASASITACGCVARVLLHLRAARHQRTFWRDLPLVPLRDTLLALQWLAALFGSHVVWRGARVPMAQSASQSASARQRTVLASLDEVETSDGR
uniref:hypothetical protein n=1 Tax=Caballeronia sp. LjRoot34 TaxID=3342325 RepID=UPI003F4FFC33